MLEFLIVSNKYLSQYMTKLVIVESPSKAKTIKKYLDKDNVEVLACFGHVRDLPTKDGSVVPEEDFIMKYVVSDKAKKHIDNIVKASKKSKEIFLATDPDREGESIAWHVVEVLKEFNAIKKDAKVSRVSFSEITQTSVRKAMDQAREIDLDLVNAQQARRALDYLVGFTLSPVLWRKLPGCKSAGRVQSVAVRLVCEREDEIRKFKTQEYWSINAGLQFGADKFSAKLTSLNGEKLDKFAIPIQARAEEITQEIQGREIFVKDVERKSQKRNPPPPFITSTLQQEGSYKLGFAAKKTMQVAQKLYEGVDIDGSSTALITYMRTDGTNIATEALDKICQFIESTFTKKYLPSKPRIYKTKVANAQEAHEAIRPTDISILPDSVKDKIDSDLYKLYDLIWRRTVACQMSSAVLDLVNVKMCPSDAAAFELTSNGSCVSFDGFYKVYKNDDGDTSKMLPNLDVGDKVDVLEIKPKQHFTEPSPRYNEASLVKTLEELGIGRPSTYATILSVIQDRGYVEIDDKKRFIPNNQGIIANAFLVKFFDKYIKNEFTALLEKELDDIAAGKLFWKEVLRNFWKDFSKSACFVSEHRMGDVINILNDVLVEQILDNKTDCGTCGSRVNLRYGKYGAFFACSQYPECNFTIKINTKPQAEQAQVIKAEPLVYDAQQNPVYVKTGPYGTYVQVGENDAVIKRVSVPQGYPNVTSDFALKLASLPYLVGCDADGVDIALASGRYGIYLKYGDKSIAIPKGTNPFEIELSDALQIIAQKQQSVAATTRGRGSDGGGGKGYMKKGSESKRSSSKKKDT